MKLSTLDLRPSPDSSGSLQVSGFSLQPSSSVSGFRSHPSPPRLALCGLAGSGKSTAAQYLVERHGFVRLSYATPIKRLVRLLLMEAGAGPCEASEMVDGAHKEDPSQFLCGKSARYAMQTLGTEWGRDLIAPDIWRRILLNKVHQHDHQPIVVDDLRFPNECEALRAEGFTIIRIFRPGEGTAAAHSSEQQTFDADLTIDNERHLDCLHARLDSLLDSP